MSDTEWNWQSLAECAGMDPDLFFPQRGESIREAKDTCRGCCVRTECLNYALDEGLHSGVFGGTSERERRPMYRQRRNLLRSQEMAG